MPKVRAAAAAVALVAVAAGLVSGGSSSDPRTPAGLPGLPPPFLGTVVVGAGGLTAAVDAYGDVVDLRPAPAGPALIDNPAARQATGTVAADTGIVPRLRRGEGRALPLWRADAVSQRYLPGTNVLETTARFGQLRARVTYAVRDGALACLTAVWAEIGGRRGRAASRGAEIASAARRVAPGDAGIAPVAKAASRGTGIGSATGRAALRGAEIAMTAATAAAGMRLRCDDRWARRAIAAAARSDRSWLRASAPLGGAAPAWARATYRRSLLVLHAATDRRSGAVAAGARDGWAYVWPRDAAAAALALAAAGHREEARRVARFLSGLDLTAARFHGDGRPVPGRAAQGDAAGWVAAAMKASADPGGGIDGGIDPAPGWRDRADYQEKGPGDYLGNAIAGAGVGAGGQLRRGWAAAAGGTAGRPGRSGAEETSGTAGRPRRAGAPRRVEDVPGRGAALATRFAGPDGLVREAGDPGSAVDAAAAWAVRPFRQPRLFAPARRSLRRLLASGGRFGIVPSADWPEADPWTAPTAWSAWAFAALAREDRSLALACADRGAALALLAALRRAATPAGALPERVDVRTGVPRSTTPLAWSHAFALLALRELWPQGPAQASASDFLHPMVCKKSEARPLSRRPASG